MPVKKSDSGRAIDRARGLTYVSGALLVEVFHNVALFVIGLAIVYAAVDYVHDLVLVGKVTIEDILLLFIYLELGAMVGIYFKTTHMPLRFLIYVAITALTRLLIGVISVDHHPGMEVIIITGAILILAVSVFILRYASFNFPNPVPELEHSDFSEEDKSA